MLLERGEKIDSSRSMGGTALGSVARSSRDWNGSSGPCLLPGGQKNIDCV